MRGWLSLLQLLLTAHHSYSSLSPSSRPLRPPSTSSGSREARSSPHTPNMKLRGGPSPSSPSDRGSYPLMPALLTVRGDTAPHEKMYGARAWQPPLEDRILVGERRPSKRSTGRPSSRLLNENCFTVDTSDTESAGGPGNGRTSRIRRHRLGKDYPKRATVSEDDQLNESYNNRSNSPVDGNDTVRVPLAAFSPSASESSVRCKRRSYHGLGPPSFHPSSPTNITAQLGASALLPCRIRNLGNKSVSWFRQRDSHILTVDRSTFIADGRFSAWHETGTLSWTLRIRYAQARDEGVYECQVSTEPKMSHFVRLTVLKPSAAIAGERDQFVRVGSTVALRCLISNAINEPDFIFWYQNGLRVVQADKSHRVISAARTGPSTTVSSLTITTVTTTDSGNYTCAPASIDPASVTLHVLHDEHPAAMQHGTTSTAAAAPSSAVLTLTAATVAARLSRIVGSIHVTSLLLLSCSMLMNNGLKEQTTPSDQRLRRGNLFSALARPKGCRCPGQGDKDVYFDDNCNHCNQTLYNFDT